MPVRAVTSELTLRVDEPEKVLQTLVVRNPRGRVNEKALEASADAFEGVLVALQRALGELKLAGGVSTKDCVEITTGDGTVIRINCPIVTLGEPTVS